MKVVRIKLVWFRHVDSFIFAIVLSADCFVMIYILFRENGFHSDLVGVQLGGGRLG